MGGIPAPSAGLVENIASVFLGPGLAEAGLADGEFGGEFAEVLSGGRSSLISRDFIPVDPAAGCEAMSAGGINRAPFCVNLRLFFTKDQNLLVQDRVNEHLLLCK
jgi:hypothetical protein